MHSLFYPILWFFALDIISSSLSFLKIETIVQHDELKLFTFVPTD